MGGVEGRAFGFGGGFAAFLALGAVRIAFVTGDAEIVGVGVRAFAVFRTFFLGFIGQHSAHFVFQHAHVVPVRGGNGQQRQAQGVEFGQHFVFALRAVHLVHHHQHGLARAAQVRGEMLVEGGQPVTAIHHQADARGFGHGGLGLAQDFRLEAPDAFRPLGHGGVGVQGDAPGVHDGEGLLAARTHLAFHAVAGDAGPVVGDGPVGADEPVEQGGFAHVGAAHQRDLGQMRGDGRGRGGGLGYGHGVL